MTWLLITLAVGALGGLLLFKCHIPGGMLVGAVAAVCIFNLATEQAFIYPQARILAQIITGAYIGGMVTGHEVRQLPAVMKPFLLVLFCMLLLNITVGLFIYRITDLDLLTSLFCAMPAGMTDAPLIAMDMGADGAVVTAMQFVRMLFGLSCLPTLILLVNHGKKGGHSGEDVSADAAVRNDRPASFAQFLPTLFLSACGGVVGKLSGLPAGTMSFSLIVVAALNISNKAKPMPKWLRRVAQVLSGSCIGVNVLPSQLIRLKQMLLPALVLCMAYFINCVLVGFLLHKFFHFDSLESMLVPSPAGATEMTLIAADMGVTSTRLSVMQIGRLVSVTMLFPQIFRIILAAAR